MMQLKDSMSNIEKIRQEIERLKKILEESTYYLDNSQQALGYSFALDDFKEFIDSLPEEKPSEDLEEEIQKTIDKYPLNKEDMGEDDIATYHQGLIFGARHFAEWQKGQIMKEAVEGKVFMSFAPGHNQIVMADVNLPTNTKVKLIIVKEDDPNERP